MIPPAVARRLPVGAEILADGGTHFRVYAPHHSTVEVVFEDDPGLTLTSRVPLERGEDGYWSVLVPGTRAGARYRFRLDGGDASPDPASRFQPEGPHGPSEVVDPGAFRWSDEGWPGVRLPGQVIYELHVGTFTPEGAWRAAAQHLEELRDVGVTVIEVMPVNDFPGKFGWGYDGVDLFAPTRLYGRPDDFRAFVDRAHALGLGVILDVVYNHLGPDGSSLPVYYPHLFAPQHRTDWGDPLNFDGEGCGPVRELCIANAGYWIAEYHLDGLRLDAAHAIVDTSSPHLLAGIAAEVRRAAGGREVIVVAEHDGQDATLIRSPQEGGDGLDAVWNDDFHHAATVALTGRREAYYADFLGTPQEFISAARHGYLYQGQRHRSSGERRGTPTAGLPPSAFVCYLENHDQVANSADGARLPALTDAGRWRAMTALLLLGPWTPMLFHGQEYAVSTPFVFFADHRPELADQIRAGRWDELARFPSLRAIRGRLPDPGNPETFRRCIITPDRRDAHGLAYLLHHDLLALRRRDATIAAQGTHGLDGAVLAAEAFALRFAAGEQGGPCPEDRLLIVNLGPDLALAPAPQPLLAPAPGCSWQVLWSSNDPRYGGSGTPQIERDDGTWWLSGHCTLLLRPGRP